MITTPQTVENFVQADRPFNWDNLVSPIQPAAPKIAEQPIAEQTNTADGTVTQEQKATNQGKITQTKKAALPDILPIWHNDLVDACHAAGQSKFGRLLIPVDNFSYIPDLEDSELATHISNVVQEREKTLKFLDLDTMRKRYSNENVSGLNGVATDVIFDNSLFYYGISKLYPYSTPADVSLLSYIIAFARKACQHLLLPFPDVLYLFMVESNFNPWAVEKNSAKMIDEKVTNVGLTQLMSSTFDSVINVASGKGRHVTVQIGGEKKGHIDRRFNPLINLAAGLCYLSDSHNKYGDIGMHAAYRLGNATSLLPSVTADVTADDVRSLLQKLANNSVLTKNLAAAMNIERVIVISNKT